MLSSLRLPRTKDKRNYIAQLDETLTKQQIVQQDLDEKQTILLAEVESENVRLYYMHYITVLGKLERRAGVAKEQAKQSR